MVPEKGEYFNSDNYPRTEVLLLDHILIVPFFAHSVSELWSQCTFM